MAFESGITDSPFGGLRVDARGSILAGTTVTGFPPPQLPLGLPGSSFDVAGLPVGGPIVTGACSFLPPSLQQACIDIGTDIISGGGGGKPGGPDKKFAPGTSGCPAGTVFSAPEGICVSPGSPGAGGGGVAVMGAFGIPAIAPTVVGNIRGNPIRSCPSGAVLGKDELCYMKGSIPRQFRKWRPSPKPPMSAADAKALRRIGTLQKKVKRLAGDANLTCKRK